MNTEYPKHKNKYLFLKRASLVIISSLVITLTVDLVYSRIAKAGSRKIFSNFYSVRGYKASQTLGYMPYRLVKNINTNELKNKKTGLRVVVLGDSVEIKSEFPEQLEQLINDGLDKNIRVLNASVSGYGIYQKCTFLMENFSIFDPDMVILGAIHDDFGLTPVIVRIEDKLKCFLSSNRSVAVNRFLLKNSSLYRMFLLKKIKAENKKIDTISNQEDELYKTLKNASEFLNSEDVIFLIVIIPKLIGHEKNMGMEVFNRIEKISSDLKIDTLNILDISREHDLAQYRIAANDDTHYNKKGGSLIADRIFKYIDSRSLISE